MNLNDCPREPEVLDTMTAGRWSFADELQAHAASCPVCGDLAAVAGAFAEEMQAEMRTADVPPSGLVWWRAQRRAREEAARTAARAITFVQTASILGAIAAALTLLGGVGAMSKSWRAWFANFSDALYFGGVTIPAWIFPLLLAFAVTLALAPFALYFAVRED